MRRLMLFALLAATGQAAQFYNDTMNAANGTLLTAHTSDSGATYTNGILYTGTPTIFNNGTVHDLYQTANSAVASSAAGADVNLKATVTLRYYSSAVISNGVILRGAANTSDAYVVSYTAGAFYIATSDGTGAQTVRTSVPYTSFSSGTLTFNVYAVGTTTVTVAVEVAGVVLVSWTDASPSAGKQASSRVGIWMGGSGGSAAGVHIASISADDGATIPLTATAAFTSASASALAFSVSAIGGTSPYTYQWYRSLTSGFTPGAGNILSGQTSTTLTNTPPDAQSYWYKAVATDSAAASVTSNQVGGQLYASGASICAIGDSITFGQGLSAGQDPVTQMTTALTSIIGVRSVISSNQGHPGATTADWLPGAGSGYLATAESACAALSPAATIGIVMLGSNDSTSVAGATWASNMSTIINHLLANGMTKVIVNQVNYTKGPATLEAYTARVQDYNALIPSLVNGSTIFSGDATAFSYFLDNFATAIQSDGVHPNATGAAAQGRMWALAVARVAGWLPSGGGAWISFQ